MHMPSLSSFGLPLATGLAAVVSSWLPVFGEPAFETSVEFGVSSGPVLAVQGQFTDGGGRDIVFISNSLMIAHNVARSTHIEDLGANGQSSLAVLRNGPGGLDQLFTAESSTLLEWSVDSHGTFSSAQIAGAWGSITEMQGWTAADGNAYLVVLNSNDTAHVFRRTAGNIAHYSSFQIASQSSNFTIANVNAGSASPELVVGYASAVTSYNFDGTEDRVNALVVSNQPMHLVTTRISGMTTENVLFTVGEQLFRFDASLLVGEATHELTLSFIPKDLSIGQVGMADPIEEATDLVVTGTSASQTVVIRPIGGDYSAADIILASPLATGSGTNSPMFADFDGDGDNDLFTVNSASQNFTYSEGTRKRATDLLAEISAITESPAGMKPSAAIAPAKPGGEISFDLSLAESIDPIAKPMAIYLNVYEAQYEGGEISAIFETRDTLEVDLDSLIVPLSLPSGSLHLLELTFGDSESDESRPAEFYLASFAGTESELATMPAEGTVILEKGGKGKSSGIIRKLPKRRRPIIE